MSEFKFPTEEIELPSKGLVYSKDNPLSSGKVEIKYMTAKEEDILSNQAYIENGTVLDKLLDSVMVSKINIKDLIIGDKNAVLIATRILGYGSDYKTIIGGKEQTINLSELENRPFDGSSMVEGKNEFSFTLPHSDTPITYKILTGHEESKIERELKGLKKINKESSPEASTRLKYTLTSVNGETETKNIREFVDNYFLARDARAFREHLRYTQPDVDLNVILDSGEEVTVPIGLSFFWPDFGNSTSN
ncbi:hypothetical protein N9H39_00055 [Gammaproteobacteria bacterium]|nr:hypothetical protein [Gammaproteobacteria bacterium]MDB4272278.1 hypothetical protein [bacterium]